MKDSLRELKSSATTHRIVNQTVTDSKLCRFENFFSSLGLVSPSNRNLISRQGVIVGFYHSRSPSRLLKTLHSQWKSTTSGFPGFSVGWEKVRRRWCELVPIPQEVICPILHSGLSFFSAARIFQPPTVIGFQSSLLSKVPYLFVSSFFAYLGRNEEGPRTSRHSRWLRGGQVTPFLAKSFRAEPGWELT